MYKGFRYNVVMFLLLLIIGFVAGTSTGVLSGLPEDPLENLPGQEIVDEQPSEQEEKPSKFTPPSQNASAFERLAFAFKVMEEGEGFSFQVSQSVVAMGQEQKILIIGYRAGDKNISEEWQYASGIGKNQFSLSYSDAKNVYVNTITNSSHYSYSKKSYTDGYSNSKKTYSFNEYVQKYGVLNSFPVKIDQTTSTIVKYDTRSDDKYYIIKVSVDTNKVSQTYINSFEANGATGVDFSLMTFTFKISKKTGFIYSVEKEEQFKTKYFNFNVDCTAKMKSVYTSIDTSQIKKIEEIVTKNFK